MKKLNAVLNNLAFLHSNLYYKEKIVKFNKKNVNKKMLNDGNPIHNFILCL
jgi:hypothetical protein